MIQLPGGVFEMGSDHFYPEEAPAHRAEVSGFRIDRGPVSNAQFAAFIAASGHVTTAECVPDPTDYPGAPPEMIYAGSLVFSRPTKTVKEGDWNNWWSLIPGADWRHPLGPGSTIDGLDDHPVVQVSAGDAEAYAAWAGKALPSEAEWEYAARGGLAAQDYAWGDSLAPAGKMLANYWQGNFPNENLLLDGFERTSPVGSFPPNGFGLYDMIGNVWEWTADWFSPRHTAAAAKSCCFPSNPRGGKRIDSFDPAMPEIRIPRRVLKGGSHLCAENYCQRYRPAARHPEMIDTSTCHIGFRCIIRDN